MVVVNLLRQLGTRFCTNHPQPKSYFKLLATFSSQFLCLSDLVIFYQQVLFLPLQSFSKNSASSSFFFCPNSFIGFRQVTVFSNLFFWDFELIFNRGSYSPLFKSKAHAHFFFLKALCLEAVMYFAVGNKHARKTPS